MRLGFLGAAGEVTGSCTLVEAGDTRFLVDCGMFQGGAEARSKNLKALNLGFDVRRLDFVLLTHAHIDHSGLLPRLVMLGYKGPIYATPATIDLLGVLLPDSAHIQEKEAEWQLRHRHRRGRDERGVPAPLYSVAQALSTLKLLRPVSYGQPINPAENVQVGFHDAGQQGCRHGLQVCFRLDQCVRRAGHAGHIGTGGEMRFFFNAVLRDGDDC